MSRVAGRRTIARQRGLGAGHLLGLLLACPFGQAWAVPTCTVAPTATLSFGTVVALAATGDISTNTGSSFWVNCTSDTTVSPSLYSATSRTLLSGAGSLPFTLSVNSPGGIEIASAPPGTQLGIVRDGTNQTVVLYGRIFASSFQSLPAGVYTRSIVLTIEY